MPTWAGLIVGLLSAGVLGLFASWILQKTIERRPAEAAGTLSADNGLPKIVWASIGMAGILTVGLAGVEFSKRALNPGDAVYDLRLLNSDLALYQTLTGSYPKSLKEFWTKAPADKKKLEESSVAPGYKFDYSASYKDENGRQIFTGYNVLAKPKLPIEGSKIFRMDESGVIEASSDNGKTFTPITPAKP
jgi:hypothetical protein